MPKQTRHLAVLAAAALAVTTLTAQAAAHPSHRAGTTLRTERVWFTCHGATGLSQLDGASGWSAKRPHGDGCASLDTTQQSGTGGDSVRDTVFTGTYRGTLDRLTLRLHGMSVFEPDPIELSLGITVDDKPVVPWPTHVDVTRDHDDFEVATLSVIDIGMLDKADATEHDVTVTVGMGGNVAARAWHWGSADAPSGITFHSKQLAETVVRAERDSQPPDDGGEAPVPVGPMIAAGPASQTAGYYTPLMAMAPDTTLTFGNADQVVHDVTARKLGPDGRPVFQSKHTPTGSASTVAGAATLPPGSYEFYCSLHPNMTGTLHVVGAG